MTDPKKPLYSTVAAIVGGQTYSQCFTDFLERSDARFQRGVMRISSASANCGPVNRQRYMILTGTQSPSQLHNFGQKE
jgi:hypothetical protein